jgi:hypothetical protein
MSSMELEQVLKDFQDYLAPRLDTYEQAIYLYLFRHTRLIGVEEAVVGFKSARRRIACGIGEKGKPMSENTAYEKLQSLQKKGCIVILDSNRDGRKIRLKLPSEIPGVVVVATAPAPPDLEAEDFFEIPENRNRILAREGHRCFYCLRQLTQDNCVIEHITSRRTLYREGFLDAAAFQERQQHVERLRAGELKPPSGGLTSQ